MGGVGLQYEAEMSVTAIEDELAAMMRRMQQADSVMKAMVMAERTVNTFRKSQCGVLAQWKLVTAVQVASKSSSRDKEVPV